MLSCTEKDAIQKAIKALRFYDKAEVVISQLKEDRDRLKHILEEREKGECSGMQEDAISREAVCDYIAEFVNNEFSTQAECEMVDSMIEGIQHLPSVTQKSKTGHWILTSDDDYEYCTCSECGYQNGENWMIGSQIKFCQECGAKMVESQERSEE